MKTEEQFESTLKDIETGIIQVFRRHSDLTDYAVLRAVEAAVNHYKAVVRQHALKPVSLDGLDLAVFEAVQRPCEEWLRGKGGSPPLTAEQVLDCLRRLVKSVKYWTRESGRQGYLSYVKQFIA